MKTKKHTQPPEVKCTYRKRLHFKGPHHAGLDNYWQCPVCKRKGYLHIGEDNQEEMSVKLHTAHAKYGFCNSTCF